MNEHIAEMAHVQRSVDQISSALFYLVHFACYTNIIFTFGAACLQIFITKIQEGHSHPDNQNEYMVTIFLIAQ